MVQSGNTSNLQEFENRIREHLKKGPQIHASAYVSEKASISGLVELGENSSVWPMATLRGDIAPIHVGKNSNVQDSAVLHVADGLPCLIGDFCTIGHSAIVHACQVEDECLIGMGAIILDGAVIGAQSIIGAASLVTQNTRIPAGSLVFGSPAKVIRALSVEERQNIRNWAERYVIVSREHQRADQVHHSKT